MTTPEYWVRHVREAVRFADGVGHAARAGHRRLSGDWPQAVCWDAWAGVAGERTAIRQRLPCCPACGDVGDWQQMLSLGELYVRGVAIDWAALIVATHGTR